MASSAYAVWDNLAVGTTIQEALVKESVQDLVTNMFPLDARLQTLCGSVPLNNIYTEFPVDTYSNINRATTAFSASADLNASTNAPLARPEGFTYTTTSPFYAGKLRMVAEIQGLQFDVTGTDRVMPMYGIGDRYAYQAMKTLREVTDNFEYSFMWGPGSPVQGNDLNTTAPGAGVFQSVRQTQGLMLWLLKSGLERSKIGTNGANNGVAGTGDATFVDGNGNIFGTNNTALNRSAMTWAYDAAGLVLDLGLFNDQVMAKWWQLIGNTGTTVAFCSPRMKNLLSLFANNITGNVNNRQIAAESQRLVVPISYFETDYGIVQAELNRHLSLGLNFSITQSTGSTSVASDECMAIFNPEKFKIGTVRPLHYELLAKTGDFTRGLFLGEMGFGTLNPQAGTAVVNAVP